MIQALRQHWPEYLMEGAELGMFMLLAGLCTAWLEYPGSPLRQDIGEAWMRRVLVGLGMGLTAVGIIYSPLGKRSGAHFNPAVTLSFFWLGLVERWDAAWYLLAQFAGGVVGVVIAAGLLGAWFTRPPVEYIVTVPGSAGPLVAFALELLMAFILMMVVLLSTNTPRLHPFTGVFAGALVALFISLESPLSGMSINPARTLASAAPADIWTDLWIYFLAPPLGMLAAAEVWIRRRGYARSAKLHHAAGYRCIFRCHGHHGPTPDSPRAHVRRTLAGAD